MPVDGRQAFAVGSEQDHGGRALASARVFQELAHLLEQAVAGPQAEAFQEQDVSLAGQSRYHVFRGLFGQAAQVAPVLPPGTLAVGHQHGLVPGDFVVLAGGTGLR